MSAIVDSAPVAHRTDRLVHAQSASELEQFSSHVPGGQLSPSFARERADTHWMLLDACDRLAARCSLWWRHVPAHANEQLGLIGNFAAISAHAGVSLLFSACNELAAKGCTLAIGPIDGSTWHRYRLVTERGSEPPFFMEPDNPDWWVFCFREAGFTTFASYFSALCSNLSRKDPRMPRVTERVRGLEIELRQVRLEQAEQELRRLYPVTRAFSNNLLFTPVSESEFVAQYLPVMPHVRPELILIAERRDVPVGFVFAVPDLLQGRRGSTIDTVIIKTLAVVPQFEGIGLGSLLVSRANEIAAALGYKRAIYALMHEHNFSRNISRRYGEAMRRYELFARSLGGPQ